MMRLDIQVQPTRPNMAAPPVSEVIIIEEIQVDDENIGKGVIALVCINRPSKLNALNSDVMSGLKAMCNWAEKEEKIRLVIIKGAEPLQPEEGKRAKPIAFVAGADISEFTGKNSNDIRKSFKHNAWEAIWNLSKPTIAMVDGFTLGGGLEVACSCDIRMVSSRSKFGTPEITLGLIPGGGGTQRLGHLIGYGKALEFVLSGEMVSANEALRIGLVNHVYEPEELLGATLKLARTIASKSPHTLKVAKKVVRASLELPISEGVALEAEEFAKLFDTEDKEIGVEAFLNGTKTTPNWKGK